MARKTKEDAEQTRQAILDSALQTFYEKGFSRTTFDEIARRINLTKGAVYWHFRNKADVIAALVMQKISEQHKLYDMPQPQTLDELRQACVLRAEQIEKDKDFRRFLFFIIYRMEWSVAVLDSVWKQIGELCEIPDKKLHDCLVRLQKNGEIKPDADIQDVGEIFTMMWKGIVDRYIFGRKEHKENINLSGIVAKGFDLVMAGIKMEKK